MTNNKSNQKELEAKAIDRELSFKISRLLRNKNAREVVRKLSSIVRKSIVE